MARVGFDLDGVWYDFRKAHSEFEIGRGNAHCTLEAADPGWDYFDGWGMSLDEWLRSYADGVDAGLILRYGDPLPGAVESSRRLAEAGHTIHIVTDRSVGTDLGSASRATAAWLADHGFVFHSLTFSRDKTVVPVDVFIEDRLQNADAINATGTPCYLINRPWNDQGDDGRLRVDSLDEFVREVEARFGKVAA
jgi:hypothetical protein